MSGDGPHERADALAPADPVGSDVVDVRARPHGPWVVRAGVPVVQVDAVRATDGTVIGWGQVRAVSADPRRGDVALCRCGRTGSAPTCDRSHRSMDAARDGLPCARPSGLDVAGLRALARRCPVGGVLVAAGAVMAGAGVCVRFVDGTVRRSTGPGLVCSCGRHVVPLTDGTEADTRRDP